MLDMATSIPSSIRALRSELRKYARQVERLDRHTVVALVRRSFPELSVLEGSGDEDPIEVWDHRDSSPGLAPVVSVNMLTGRVTG